MRDAPKRHVGSFTVLVNLNDLQYAIKYCKVHHFADDTDLMNFQTSVKTFVKQINKNKL